MHGTAGRAADSRLQTARRGRGRATRAAATEPQPTDASAEASAEPAAPDSASLEQYEKQRADAIVDVARAYLQHRPRTLGSGYELVLISSKDQLEHGPGSVGGFLRDGTPIPLHVARMLASDAARVDVTLGEAGEILDVGRRTRTIPSAIARALWLRDGACRVPGCSRKRHLHAHHIHPWALGGPTRLSNLVLVCSGHLRMIHEDKLFTEIRDGKFVFLDQLQRAIPHAPPSEIFAGFHGDRADSARRSLDRDSGARRPRGPGRLGRRGQRVTHDLLDLRGREAALPYYGWLFPETATRVNIGITYTYRAGPLHSPGRIVIGEAGRMTHPATGEGIYQGMRSGMFAAEAIDDIINDRASEDAALARYDRRCAAAFLPSFWAGALARGILRTSLLDYVVKSSNAPRIKAATARVLAHL